MQYQRFHYMMPIDFCSTSPHTHPPSQVISSGYIVEDLPPSSEHSKCCRITYIHQLGSTVMPFFSKDLLGVSSLMEKLCLSMKKYILTT